MLPSTATPLLALDAVGMRFPNGVQALDGLELSIARGEFLSLLGPSGCGKSTALRLLAGLARPTAGTVRRPEGLRPGFVFQEPTLMPWATVFDNVRLPLRLKGLGADAVREDVDAALEQVGLGGFARAYPRELSGGMRMRVSIARALVTRPDVLLLDEPFAALDEITRGRLDDELLALWHAHRLTVVFVTHSVYEAIYLSTRVAVFGARPGRVVETIRVDAPHPRGDAFRADPAYARDCVRASAALRAAHA
ncbi:MAG TPA: ABC transporter ATP-binding protein [Burkholderiaceae bacterium]|nr:ABC transporter ATP-binding protein [Burkholderiaceae bacterium]